MVEQKQNNASKNVPANVKKAKTYTHAFGVAAPFRTLTESWSVEWGAA